MRRALFLVALAPTIASAQPAPRNYYDLPNEMQREAKTGEEQVPSFPSFPRDGSLVKVQVNALDNFEYFVDLESVSVGSDGVVRYTLVSRSSAGGTNIAYEGIRCKDRERKLYALGRTDGTWSAVRDPKWLAISNLPVNRAQAALYSSYFCPARVMSRDAEQARKALRAGGDPLAGGSVDMWSQPR